VIPKAGPNEQYSKVEMWIGKKTLVPFKALFYNRSGRRWKALRVKRIKKINNRYIATVMVMKDLIQGSETAITLSDIRSKISFPDSIFSQSSLGK
jgi:hypothetical protein